MVIEEDAPLRRMLSTISECAPVSVRSGLNARLRNAERSGAPHRVPPLTSVDANVVDLQLRPVPSRDVIRRIFVEVL